ncbi:MAG: hypothetical protein ACTHOU_06880, partial [Aureliella sp.]
MPSIRWLLDNFGPPPQTVCRDWACQLAETVSNWTDSDRTDSDRTDSDWTELEVEDDGRLVLAGVDGALAASALKAIHGWLEPGEGTRAQLRVTGPSGRLDLPGSGAEGQRSDAPLARAISTGKRGSRRVSGATMLGSAGLAARVKVLGAALAGVSLVGLLTLWSLFTSGDSPAPQSPLTLGNRSSAGPPEPKPAARRASRDDAQTSGRERTPAATSAKTNASTSGAGPTQLPAASFTNEWTNAADILKTQPTIVPSGEPTSPATLPLAAVAVAAPSTASLPIAPQPPSSTQNDVVAERDAAADNVGAGPDAKPDAKPDAGTDAKPDARPGAGPDVMQQVSAALAAAEADADAGQGQGSDAAGQSPDAAHQPAVALERDRLQLRLEMPQAARPRPREPHWQVRVEPGKGFSCEPSSVQTLAPRQSLRFCITDESAASPPACLWLELVHRGGRGGTLECRFTGGAVDQPELR